MQHTPPRIFTARKRPMTALESVGARDMNDVLFLLLGLGGFAALFGYALFCNRN